MLPVYCRGCDGTVQNVLGFADPPSPHYARGDDPAGLGDHFVLFDCADHEGSTVVLSERGKSRAEEKRLWDDVAASGRFCRGWVSEYFVNAPVEILSDHRWP